MPGKYLGSFLSKMLTTRRHFDAYARMLARIVTTNSLSVSQGVGRLRSGLCCYRWTVKQGAQDGTFGGSGLREGMLLPSFSSVFSLVTAISASPYRCTGLREESPV